ncbi:MULTISPECIES: PIN domain-containing protein [Candidatus Cryosericum]|jgi:predicted nucleic acid-binding protein|nr:MULTISPECIES: PIN domain-containing protein [Cryosericum]
MSNNVRSVEDYDFAVTDRIFVDANVWMHVYGQSAPDSQVVKLYSGAMQKMLAAHSCLYTDVLVISEVINRYIRIDMKVPRVGKTYTNFKDFRRSTDFPLAAKGATDIVRRILGATKTIANGFEEMQVPDLLRDFESGQYDFNDQVIGILCAREGLTILTDDADFARCPAPILTANPRLLRS